MGPGVVLSGSARRNLIGHGGVIVSFLLIGCEVDVDLPRGVLHPGLSGIFEEHIDSGLD